MCLECVNLVHAGAAAAVALPTTWTVVAYLKRKFSKKKEKGCTTATSSQ